MKFTTLKKMLLPLPAKAIAFCLMLMVLPWLADAQPCTMTAHISKVNPTCWGDCDGTMTAHANGGNGPYTYMWSNGETTQSIDSLCAGTYVVTITDANNCTAMYSTAIQKGKVGGNVVVTHATCGMCNGSITATGNGGNGAPYTYMWNTGATTQTIDSLCPGSYTVTITDHMGCTFVCTKNVGVTGAGAFTLGETIMHDTSCVAGTCSGSISVSPSPGPSANYTYMWNNGATTAMIDMLCVGNYTVTVSNGNGCTMSETYTIADSSNCGNPCNITVMLAKTNPTCYGDCDGEITANVTNGSGNYTYMWSNGATTQTIDSLCAGTYTVTVMDVTGQCTSTMSTTIHKGPVGANVTKQHPTCGACNGMITVTGNGGNGGPYTYMWNTGATTSSIDSLCAGTYTVTITDSQGCTYVCVTTLITSGSGSFTLNPTVTDNSSCDTMMCTGSIEINPTPAGNYTYMWSNGATTNMIDQLCAGTYTVTVDNGSGCTITATYTIHTTGSSAFMLNETLTDNSACGTPCNGMIELNPTPPGNYMYMWSNGETTSTIDELCAGTYTVTVDNGSGCTLMETFTIHDTGSGTFDLNASVNSNTSCDTTMCNGSIMLSPTPAANYMYMWSNGATTDMIDELCAGTYIVTVDNGTGCTVTETYTIQDSTLMVSLISVIIPDTSCSGVCSGAISITPSPSGNYTYMWSNGAMTDFVDGLCAGNYTVTVTDASGCMMMESFMVPDSSNCGASCINDFTTYSQGGWGNPGNPGQYLANMFPGCYGTVVVGDTCGFTITLTSAQDITDLLPQGGQPTALTQDYINPGPGNISALVGQVLAVQLSLGFDVCDPNFSVSNTHLGEQINNDTASLFYGWSIQAIYDTARKVLSSCGSMYTPSQVNDALDMIIQNYDAGVNLGMFVCPDDFITSNIGSAERQINAYPNPFSEKITVDTKKQSNVTVTVSDIMGRELNKYYNVTGLLEISGNFTKGIYILTVENPATGFRETIRTICTH